MRSLKVRDNFRQKMKYIVIEALIFYSIASKFKDVIALTSDIPYIEHNYFTTGLPNFLFMSSLP